MTTGMLKTDIGPQDASDAVPIPMAMIYAAIASAPFWLAIGWAVNLVH